MVQLPGEVSIPYPSAGIKYHSHRVPRAQSHQRCTTPDLQESELGRDDELPSGGREGDRRIGQPVQPPRRDRPPPQRSPLRAHPGRPEKQKRAAAGQQPRPQESSRAPPRRPRRVRVPPHRRVRRRGLPRPTPPPRRPLREGHGPLLGQLHRRQVLEGVLAGAVGGGRGAGGVCEGDQGELRAAGGAAGGEAVLRRRRHRSCRHRRLRVGALAGRLRGGRRGETGHRGRVPSLLPLGEGVRVRREGEGVPAGQAAAARPLRCQQGDVRGHRQLHAAAQVASQCVYAHPWTCMWTRMGGCRCVGKVTLASQRSLLCQLVLFCWSE